MDNSKKNKLMDLIAEYLLDKDLYQDDLKSISEIDKKIDNKDYFVKKRIIDYIFKKCYDKKRENIIRECIEYDLILKENLLNDQKFISSLLQELYQKIVNIVNSLTQEEFIEICDLINEEIKSYNYVLMDNPYSDGKRIIPLIGLTESEKYLIERQNGYREMLVEIQEIYSNKDKKIRKRVNK